MAYEKTPEKAVEETVTITKSQLQEMLKDIDMLKKTADVGRISRYNDAHRDNQKLTCNLIKIGEKLVVSFKMGTNNAKNQTLKCLLEDKTEVEIPYNELAKVSKVRCVILGKTITDDEIVFSLETEGGKKISVNAKYVNPV